MFQIVCYAFSIVAFGVFAYSFFFSNDPALKEQALYWFFSSIVIAIIPKIKQLKYKDLEVVFKDEIKKVEESLVRKTRELKDLTLPSVYQRLQNIQQDFFNTFPNDTFGAQQIVKEAFDVLDHVEPQFPDNLFIKNVHAYMLKNNALLMKKLNRPDEVKKSLSESFEIFKTILDKDPVDAGAWNGLGNVYLLRGEPEKALHNIDKALEIDPNYSAALNDKKIAKRMINKKKS